MTTLIHYICNCLIEAVVVYATDVHEASNWEVLIKNVIRSPFSDELRIRRVTTNVFGPWVT